MQFSNFNSEIAVLIIISLAFITYGPALLRQYRVMRKLSKSRDVDSVPICPLVSAELTKNEIVNMAEGSRLSSTLTFERLSSIQIARLSVGSEGVKIHTHEHKADNILRDIPVGSLWCHHRSKANYIVLGYANLETRQSKYKINVVYANFNTGSIWVRPYEGIESWLVSFERTLCSQEGNPTGTKS